MPLQFAVQDFRSFSEKELNNHKLHPTTNYPYQNETFIFS